MKFICGILRSICAGFHPSCVICSNIIVIISLEKCTMIFIPTHGNNIQILWKNNKRETDKVGI